MSEAITQAKPKTTTQTLSDLLRDRKDAIAQLVPKHLTPERLMRVAVNCVAKTPGLQKCTPTSLLQSVLVAAELGLEPGGALGHLYLVPFKETCTPIIGYRGLIELARRSGEISSIRAVVVRERDTFSLREGIDQAIDHVPYLDGDAGALRLVYCVIKLKDGGLAVEVMTRAQVEAIRARSRSGRDGPWVTDFEEMAKKTVARRALKWQPISSERFQAALEQDSSDYVDGEAREVDQADKLVEAALAGDLKERVKAKTGRMALPVDVAPPEIHETAEAEATA